MLSCHKCNSSLPEGMRFCLQCGAPLTVAAPRGTNAAGAGPAFDSPSAPAPAPTVAAPLGENLRPTRVAPSREPTITLKVAPSVVIAPRVDTPPGRLRPNLRPDMDEVDEEALRRAFERPPVQPGTVACRFCKSPLHLEGEYCEQCGAPIEEAAPPGVWMPKPQPAAPLPSPPATAPAPASDMAPPASSAPSMPAAASALASNVAQPAPSAGSPARSPTAPPSTSPYGAPPPAPVLPAAQAKPIPRTPLQTRATMTAPPLKPKLEAPEPPPGLVGRLKGLLKTKKVSFPVRHP